MCVEILAPQRPPAPPTEYFQLNIGGYDPETLLKVTDDVADLPGKCPEFKYPFSNQKIF